MIKSVLERRIVRLLVSSALSGLLANEWHPYIPLEWMLPAGILGHYLLLTAFAYFIDRKPHWSIVVGAIRELLLTCVQFSLALWVASGWILYITGGEPERFYKLISGLVSILLSLIFLLLLTTHTLIHRRSINQRFLSFTMWQLFAVMLILSGAMYLNATNSLIQPSMNLVPVYRYGWPFPCLSVAGDTPRVEILFLLGNLIFFSVPSAAFLVLCGGPPGARHHGGLRSRLIALGILLLGVAVLSIPTTAASSPRDEFPLFREYGWPISFYEDGGKAGVQALLLDLYSYALFTLVIFSVRSNEAPPRAEASA